MKNYLLFIEFLFDVISYGKGKKRKESEVSSKQYCY